MANDTIDALESLIRSEGWRIFCEQARAEFRGRTDNGLVAVLKGTDGEALAKLRQIVAAREAVEWVLALPKEEIARLRRQEAPPSETETLRQWTPETVLAMGRRGNL